MNPTDQARKEARKKELKKNKKQRQTVRQAVLKGKNPRDIIEELEKIDDMEYNPITPCPHAPKVMFEKRRKLAEIWDRVIKSHEKDQPEQYAEFKKLWQNYQGRKIEVVKYYESVISAQDVDVDAIPLPSADGGLDIPLPPPSLFMAQGPPRSVLKKPPSVLETAKPILCPGVPADVPPSIEDYDVEVETPEKKKRTIRFGDETEAEAGDAGQEDEVEDDEAAPGAPSSLQKKMLAMAGQDLDQFMREMEEVHRSREAEKAAGLQARLARLEGEAEPGPPGMEMITEHGTSLAPPPSSYRPVAGAPVRPGVPPPGIRPPPGPPPGETSVSVINCSVSAPSYDLSLTIYHFISRSPPHWSSWGILRPLATRAGAPGHQTAPRPAPRYPRAEGAPSSLHASPPGGSDGKATAYRARPQNGLGDRKRPGDEEPAQRRHQVRADQPQGEEGRGEEAREWQEEGGELQPQLPPTATADAGQTTTTTKGQIKGRRVCRLHERNEQFNVDFVIFVSFTFYVVVILSK